MKFHVPVPRRENANKQGSCNGGASPRYEVCKTLVCVALRLLSLACPRTMVRRGYGVGFSSALVLCLAFSSFRDAQAFVLPYASRAGVASQSCSRSRSWGASGPEGARRASARTLKGLEVAAGDNAVGSASKLLTEEEEVMRVAQIQGFTDKVREYFWEK